MSLATELVAGGFAGAVGIMATQPMDTIRHAAEQRGEEVVVVVDLVGELGWLRDVKG